MKYTKTEWQNLPDTTTPITADRLNNIENGIEYLFEHGVGGGDTLPIGVILPHTSATIPSGYMVCDGSAISRTTYADLFNAIGTTYGAGDGSTTFNLPNLKGKVPVGQDTTQSEFDNLGETGGEKTHTLTIEEMPSHKHNGIFEYYSEREISNRSDAGGGGHDINYSSFDGSMDNSYSYLYTADAGGGQAHNNLQPYIVLNYIIKAFQSAGTVANVVNITTDSDTDTYSCNYVNKTNEYSLNEISTHKKWIDGKPIYRKVFTGNITDTTNSWVDLQKCNLVNVDNVVNISGIIKNTKTDGRVLPVSAYESTSYYCTFSYLGETDYLQCIVNGWTYTTFEFKYIVVIEYTKTTD